MLFDVQFGGKDMRMNTKFGRNENKMNASFKDVQTITSAGQDGLSAYEVAINNGFEGTEAEWLASLKGEPGAAGPAGADGKDGKDGKDGNTGPAGKDGSPGPAGPAGADGKDGADGISPSVTVQDIDGGHRVSITDKDGTKVFDVMDGKDGAGGGGTSVQPDWSVNDENDPAYVKNRTHYETPPKFDIQWDGNMDGRFAFPLDSMGKTGAYLVHVSDVVISVEEMIDAYFALSPDMYKHPIRDDGVDSEMLPGAHVVSSAEVVVVYDNATLSVALGLPDGLLTNGTYFICLPERGMYVSEFCGYPGVVKLDPKYLPEADLTGVVRYDDKQELYHYQKLNARTNVGLSGNILLQLLNGTIPSNLFNEDASIEEVVGGWIKHIKIGAFNGCENLTKVDVANLESIETSAFSHCISLDTLIIRNEKQVVSLKYTEAFYNTPIEKHEGAIYVPRALLADYKGNLRWASFIVRALEDYTVDGTITGELDETKI